MADLSMQQNSLVRGSSCWVRAGSETNPVTIGYCDSFRANKTYSLQRAQGIGELLPFSIDPQSIQVSVSMSGFIPNKKIVTSVSKLRGQGDTSILSFDVSASDYVDGLVTKFPYMDLVDKSTGAIICTITDAVEQSFSITTNGGSYVKGDLSFEAVDMNVPSDMKTYQNPEALNNA